MVDNHRRAELRRVEEDRIFHQKQKRREQEEQRRQEKLRKREEEWVTAIPHFKIDLGEVSESLLPDVLRALFHTIFFQRSLGILRTDECQAHCESLDICYATVPDYEFFHKLEKIISELEKKLKKGKKKTLCFSFGKREMKKSFLVFSSQVFEYVWEKWSVSVTYKKRSSKSHPGDRDRERLRTEDLVRQKIFEIIHWVNENKDHIPGNAMPFEDGEGNLILGMTFDWEFSFPKKKNSRPHFLDILKKGPPQIF